MQASIQACWQFSSCAQPSVLVDQGVERDLSVDRRRHRPLQRFVGRRRSLEEIQEPLGRVDIERIGGQRSACRTYLADELTHHTCVIIFARCKQACMQTSMHLWRCQDEVRSCRPLASCPSHRQLIVVNGVVAALKATPLRGRPRSSLDRHHHPAPEGLFCGKGRRGPPSATVQPAATPRSTG